VEANTNKRDLKDEFVSEVAKFVTKTIKKESSVLEQNINALSFLLQLRDVLTFFAQLFANVALIKQNLPINLHQATRVMSKLGSGLRKLIYITTYLSASFGQATIYIPQKHKVENYKVVLEKTMFYFLIIPILQKSIYINRNICSNEMHHENQTKCRKVWNTLMVFIQNLQIILTLYNHSPKLCMNKPYIFLSCLVLGPSTPKTKIMSTYSH
ncbi:hypothetical protein CR513_14667, partial [Mucuna pruriens]